MITPFSTFISSLDIGLLLVVADSLLLINFTKPCQTLVYVILQNTKMQNDKTERKQAHLCCNPITCCNVMVRIHHFLRLFVSFYKIMLNWQFWQPTLQRFLFGLRKCFWGKHLSQDMPAAYQMIDPTHATQVDYTLDSRPHLKVTRGCLWWLGYIMLVEQYLRAAQCFGRQDFKSYPPTISDQKVKH